MQNMNCPKLNSQKWIIASLFATVATLGASGVLRAQPDVNDIGKGENLNTKPVPAPSKMTPDQRRQMVADMQKRFQEMRDNNLRATLAKAGFDDKTLQDDVIAFTTAQNATQNNDARDKMQKLNQAVKNNAPDEELAKLLSEIREDAAAVKLQRETALQELDEKIGYSTKPRLEATLTIAGIIGENNAANGRGNFGGFNNINLMGMFGGGAGNKDAANNNVAIPR